MEASTALVTGCLGNLGIIVSRRLSEAGYDVTGVDNNGRGKQLGGSVNENIAFFGAGKKNLYINGDIADIDWNKFKEPFDVIVHCAAQVSHPWSIQHPMEDFMTNAYGTVNLLEFIRQHNDKAKFIHVGSSKMYGKNVDKTEYFVDEDCSFDQTIKTPFGCSKAAADLYVQEYGLLYGLTTSVLRPGVFTGPYAKPVIYQNWLGHIFNQIMTQDHVDIIGWEGKQIRDVLHTSDLVDAIMFMIADPPTKGAVFNIAGGEGNAITVLDAVNKIMDMTSKKVKINFLPEREGDWFRYIGDNSKLSSRYPHWDVTKDLPYIMSEMYHQHQVK